MNLLFLFLPLLWLPSLVDQYTVVKWIFSFFGIAALLLYTRKNKSHFALPADRGLRYLFYGFVLCSLYSWIQLGQHYWHQSLLERLGFVSLVVIVMNNSVSSIWPHLVPAWLVVLNLALQTAEIDLFDLTRGSRPSSTFGNVNFLGQYLGFVVVWILYIQREHHFRKYLYPCAGIFLGVIAFLGNRSVFLAVASTLPFMFFKTSYIKERLFWFFIPALVVFNLGYFSASSVPNIATKEKHEAAAELSSLHMRLELWKAALKTWGKHPLGIGAGNYEFSDVPVRVGSKLPNVEHYVYNTPHNEYLRFLVEDGVQYFLLVLLLMGYLVIRAHIAELGLLTFMGVEAFFQFPFMTAHGFVYCALFLGVILNNSAAFNLVKIKKRCVILVSVVLSLLAAKYAYAHYAFSKHRHTYPVVSRACRFMPSIWKNCAMKGIVERERGFYFSSVETFNTILNHTPYNYAVLQHKIFSHFKQGHSVDPKACYDSWKYMKILDKKSEISELHKEYCGVYDPYFEVNYGKIIK